MTSTESTAPADATSAEAFTQTQIDTAGKSPEFVQLAFNATGQVIALWRHLEGLDTTFSANLLDRATDWRPALTLSTPAIVVDARVSIDANGDVAALWDQSGTPHRVLANTVLSGAVGAAVSLGDGLAGKRVAAGPPGGPVTVALGENIEAASGQDALQSIEYGLGTGWLPPVTLPDTSGVGASDLAVLEDGRRLAVWSIDGALRFTLRAPGLGWRPAAVIAASTDISMLTGPRLVAGGNGTALLVWPESVPPADYTLFASWFDGSAWETPAALSTRTGLLVFGDSLRVAADRQGHGAVVWQQTPGDPSDPATVRSVRYRNGVWEAPLALSEIGIKPSLAVHPTGHTAAVWEEGGQIIGRGFSAADPTAWSAPVEITRITTGFDVADPAVALEPDGTLVVTWRNRVDGSLWSSRGCIE